MCLYFNDHNEKLFDRNEEEQNLVAYQYKGYIYYRAYKEIKKGMELLVWYGNQYAEQLGIALKNVSINTPVDNFKFSSKLPFHKLNKKINIKSIDFILNLYGQN